MVTVRYQGQVEFAALEPLHQFAGWRTKHIDLHRWMGFGEALQDLRQVSEPGVIGGAKPDFPRNKRGTECSHYLIVQCEDLAGPGQQVMAVGRQLDAAALAAAEHRLAK